MADELIDIGSECFGKADGTVLSWRGVNYVRQEDARTAIFQAAGFGASCVMEHAPDVVMPTDTLIPGCERLFQELNNGELEPDNGR